MLALLEKVQRDDRTREAFIANPTKVMTSQVTHEPASAQQVSESNRLLFALIANDKMRDFFSKFEASASGAKAAKQEFAEAFAKQIASLKDENIMVALVGNAIVGNGIPGMSQVAYQCVCNEVPSKTSCSCTPVAKNEIGFGSNVIDPETIRSLSEAFVARAKELAKQGVLGNLQENVG
jgi:hypothetical protein